MTFQHHDQARKAALAALERLLREEKACQRAVLVDDLYGKLRLLLWLEGDEAKVLSDKFRAALKEAASPAWSDQLWIVGKETSPADRLIYDSTWEEAKPFKPLPQLRTLDRHRSKGAWFKELAAPPWPTRAGSQPKGPPVVVFYSFKGGVGRTTGLASFAIQRAQAGERVVVLDGDLDAPEVGTLLTPDESQPSEESQWGVVDYLLERPNAKEVDLADYYHVLRRDAVARGGGEIIVFPAGKMDDVYLGKLARLDFEPPREGERSPWTQLLERVRNDLSPRWILVDSRAGLADAAGVLLGGLAHLHVLFAAHSEQSWQGLRLVVSRLGAERVWRNQMQAECLLVQSMVPENIEVAQMVKKRFLDRARDEFESSYYAEDPADEGEDLYWYARDADSQDAPHQPVALSYKQGLASFRTIDDAVPIVTSDEYKSFADRICAHFLEEDHEQA